MVGDLELRFKSFVDLTTGKQGRAVTCMASSPPRGVFSIDIPHRCLHQSRIMQHCSRLPFSNSPQITDTRDILGTESNVDPHLDCQPPLDEHVSLTFSACVMPINTLLNIVIFTHIDTCFDLSNVNVCPWRWLQPSGTYM